MACTLFEMDRASSFFATEVSNRQRPQISLETVHAQAAQEAYHESLGLLSDKLLILFARPAALPSGKGPRKRPGEAAAPTSMGSRRACPTGRRTRTCRCTCTRSRACVSPGGTTRDDSLPLCGPPPAQFPSVLPAPHLDFSRRRASKNCIHYKAKNHKQPERQLYAHNADPPTFKVVT